MSNNQKTANNDFEYGDRINDPILRYNIGSNLFAISFSVAVFLFLFGFSSKMSLIPTLLLILFFSFIGKILFPIISSALFALVKFFRQTWFYKITTLSFVAAVLVFSLSSFAPFVNLSSPTTDYVYVTKSGTKYHTADCNIIIKTDNPKTVSLKDAVSKGYGPCLFCEPPALN